MDEQIVVQKRRAWMIATFLGVILSLYLLALTANEIKTYGTIAPAPASNVISVSGEGEAYIKPDLATFSFSVTESAKTVGEAQKSATTKTNAGIDALKKAGVAEKDIKTTGYNVYPKYEYERIVCTAAYCPVGGAQRIIGYEVSQSIEIKVRDLEKAGELLSLVGSTGASNISSLNFTVDNPDEINRQAREQAITKAKEKAKQLASDLGVRLVRIVSYSENNGNQMYYGKGMGGDVMMQAAAVAPSVPVGENKIVSNVSIVYEIR